MSMTIDRVGPIDPIQPGKRPGKTGQVQDSPKSDSIDISSEAQEKSELLRVQKLAEAAPDVRLEKVAELKEKINDPSYINDSVVNATANKLLDSLFG
jgi:negative regulator of flagellin synthesis FlgM